METGIYQRLFESVRNDSRNIQTKSGLWCFFYTEGNTVFVSSGTTACSNSKIRRPRPLNRNEADKVYLLWKAGKPFQDARNVTLNASYWFALFEDVFGN